MLKSLIFRKLSGKQAYVTPEAWPRPRPRLALGDMHPYACYIISLLYPSLPVKACTTTADSSKSHGYFLHKIATLLLSLIVFSSGIVLMFHSIEPSPHPFDLIAPFINAVINLGLLVYLVRFPKRIAQVMWLVFTTTMISLSIAGWYFTLQAAFSEGVQLVETLPPISAVPLLAIAALFSFVRSRWVTIAAALSWVVIAFPVLTYLAFHSDELFSPRGTEIALALGPGMMLATALIPVHRVRDRQIATLESDRAAMQALAERDPLTQLYNRRGLEKLFAKMLEHQRTSNNEASIGVILFDIDHFKAINDKYGHNVGDKVLYQVAQRCQAILRKDDLFARWGGEEFLAVIRGVEKDSLAAIAETLRLKLAEECISPVGKVTASFGITGLCKQDSMQALIHRVDSAMYTAKRQGRNRVVAENP